MSYGKIIDIGYSKKHLGFWIDTKKINNIYFKIEDNNYCCEDWGMAINDILINKFELKSLVGDEIKKISFNHYREKEKTKSKPFNYNGDYLHYICIDITTINNKYKVDIWNYHNGYYAHNVYLKWNNYKSIEYI